MSVLKQLFRKMESKFIPPMPSWDEIVAHMYGKELTHVSDKIVDVIYAKDNSKRIIILQSEYGYYKSVYEMICVYDEDEWRLFGKRLNTYPAWWAPVNSSINAKSFYGSKEDALKDIQTSYEYMTYFV